MKENQININAIIAKLQAHIGAQAVRIAALECEIDRLKAPPQEEKIIRGEELAA